MERKEAIEVIKKNWPDNSFTMLREALETLIPELKESEDERIRKILIEAVIQVLQDKYCSNRGVSKEKVIAWLEKQGNLMKCLQIANSKIGDLIEKNYYLRENLEKQDEHANFLDKIQVGDKVTRNEDGVLVNLSQLKRIAKPAEEYNITGIGSKNAQGKLGEMIKNLKPVNEVLEQKPDWNEKYIADVFEKVGLAKIAREQGNENLSSALQSALIELGKFMPQQTSAWSEEDEKILSDIVKDLVHPWNEYIPYRIEDEIKWLKNKLKSLKDRYTWKPSDEQITCLHDAITRYNQEGFSAATLTSLLEQLKKLR